MKKLELLVLALAALALGGCVGTTALGILDNDVPEVLLCPLEIRNSISVILYDNKPVEWKPAFADSKVTISLPPGEHTFMIRYYEGGSPGTGQITQEFLPGHSYRIYKQRIWLVFFTIFNVKCKDVTPKS
ncbi:MAG: hypothetical protein LBQ46_10935 [Treponema sp.]|jgi:hypothetical protein|nr:hypothetical protein [Treponema sp.]